MPVLQLNLNGDAGSPRGRAASGIELIGRTDELVRRACLASTCLLLLPVRQIGDRAGELLAEIKSEAPGACICLLTNDHELEHAMAVARACGACGILPETRWHLSDEWRACLQFMRRPDEAALHPTYLGPDASVNRAELRTPDDRALAEAEIHQRTQSSAYHPQQRHDVRLVYHELIDNVLLHAAGISGPETPYATLPEDAPIELTLHEKANRLTLTVADNHGRLHARTVWQRLQYQFSPRGVHSFSGRGLYLTYRLGLRVLIRIWPGRRTEINVLLLKDPAREDPRLLQLEPRPLVVLEVDGEPPRPSDRPGATPERGIHP